MQKLLKKLFGPSKLDLTKQWFEEEKRKPRYEVVFEVKGGIGFKRTQSFEPHYKYLGSNFIVKYTSAEAAAEYIMKSYERGYFIDKDEITYPVHQLFQASIEKAE